MKVIKNLLILGLETLIILVTISGCEGGGGGGGGNEDKTPPKAPIISEIIRLDGGKLTVNGEAEAESTIKITFPDGNSKETAAASNEAFNVTSDLAQSSGVVTATATDAAGNRSKVTQESYTSPPQEKTFQLNINNIDLKRTVDDSNIYPQGTVLKGEKITIE